MVVEAYGEYLEIVEKTLIVEKTCKQNKKIPTYY